MSTFTYQNIHHDDASPSNSDSDPFEPFESHQDQPPSRPRPFLPAIPDLRFEQSYLKSIKKFVHIVRADNEKGKGKDPVTGGELVVRRDVTPIVDSSHHLVGIEWGKVIWITTRDQVISPLLQGALWGVGSHFLRPFMSLVGSHIRSRLPSTSSENREPGWWKWWTHGLGLGSTVFLDAMFANMMM